MGSSLRGPSVVFVEKLEPRGCKSAAKLFGLARDLFAAGMGSGESRRLAAPVTAIQDRRANESVFTDCQAFR